MGQLIKILLVENDSNWLKVLTEILYLETDFEIVGVCEHKLPEIKQRLSNQPDLIIVDFNLTDAVDDIIEVIKALTQQTAAKIILVSDFEDDEFIKKAWEIGVQDYIYKNQLHWLNDKIRAVYNQHSLTLILLEELDELKKATRFNKLTPAEKEILALLKAGVSIDGIVKRLCKTEKTIHNQKSSLLKKLAVKCYKEALEIYNDFI